MKKSEISLTEDQYDTLRHNCIMMAAIAGVLTDNLRIIQDDGIPASNLAEAICDYNGASIQILDGISPSAELDETDTE